MKRVFRFFTFSFVAICMLFSMTGCKKNAEKPKENPVVTPIVAEGEYFEGWALERVAISLSEGDTEGTISWADSTTILTLGENYYDYKFVPSDTKKFKETTGKIKVVASAQTLDYIVVKTAPQAKTYKAFEEYDASGLVLTATYDKGKTEEISSGYTVKYLSGDSLKAGDQKVVIYYGGKETDLSIDTVEKLKIAKPLVSGTYTYSGTEQTAGLTTSDNEDKYTISGNKQTNAGTHKVTLSIKDYDNYEWLNGEGKDLVLDFVIGKAEQIVTKNNYSGTYDKTSHSATIVSEYADKIYYSLTELTADNYLSAGSETAVQITNAVSSQKIYYYAVGDSNHKNASGFVTVNIAKADSETIADYCYTIEVSGKKAQLPASFVLVSGISETINADGKLTFVYYTDYENGIKTNSENGADEEGSAPERAGRYVVKTIFAGNENYNESSCTSDFVVDIANLPFFINDNEEEFAWYDKSSSDYFEIYVDGTGDLAKLLFICNIGGEKQSGQVWLENGKYIATTTSQKVYELSTDELADKLVIVSEGEETRELAKFMLPKYLGTFKYDKIGDQENINSLVIYNDYGTISYTFDIYYKDKNDNLKHVTYEGTAKLNNLGDTLYFYKNGTEMQFTITISSEDDFDEINITKKVQPDYSGVYERV